jgi:predicted TIM-barrel enzyme
MSQGYLNRLPDAVWADNSIDIQEEDMVAELKEAQAFRAKHPEFNRVALLGGVAFKYTGSYTENPRLAAFLAAEAAPYLDVVTTSGRGTGTSPDVSKVRAMKQAAPDKPLAIASGVDEHNIASYAGVVDQILAASSVEGRFGEFDKRKLKKLIKLAHALPTPPKP